MSQAIDIALARRMVVMGAVALLQDALSLSARTSQRHLRDVVGAASRFIGELAPLILEVGDDVLQRLAGLICGVARGAYALFGQTNERVEEVCELVEQAFSQSGAAGQPQTLAA